MDTENLKVEDKVTQLISVLSENLKGKMNLANIAQRVPSVALKGYR
jgi:hypothetical protein